MSKNEKKWNISIYPSPNFKTCKWPILFHIFLYSLLSRLCVRKCVCICLHMRWLWSQSRELCCSGTEVLISLGGEWREDSQRSFCWCLSNTYPYLLHMSDFGHCRGLLREPVRPGSQKSPLTSKCFCSQRTLPANYRKRAVTSGLDECAALQCVCIWAHEGCSAWPATRGFSRSPSPQSPRPLGPKLD